MVKRILLILCIEVFSQTIPPKIQSAQISESLIKPVDRKEYIEGVILRCFFDVESSFGTNIYNEEENAVGWLQIRPIMVKEVNQIIGYEKYKLSDRWDKEKSVEMFWVYQNQFNPKLDIEKAARLWNGGRSGMNKKSTIQYYYRVKNRWNSLVN